VSNRFLGWPPAVLATLITVGLVVGELTDAGQRRRPPSWRRRPLAPHRPSPHCWTDRATATPRPVRQLQSAAAPLLQLLTPAVRDAINGIGQTAEE
jgi:hypothetical protein